MKLTPRFLPQTLLVALFILFAGNAPAHAATFTVTNLNDSGAGSLRQAVTDAMATPAADTINFGVSGTILLDTTLPDISSTGGALTIDGAEQAITISNSTSLTNENFTVSTVGTLTLQNLTINDGTSGVSINQGALTITNCTFSGNGITDGGAINNLQATLTISNSTFSGNTVFLAGGGILNDSGNATISNSTFSGNVAGFSGGGILNGSGTMTISNSTFSGNTSLSGGGIGNSTGNLTIINSTFSGNDGDVGYGGGISNDAGTVTVINSTFSGNIAPAGQGGSIYNNGSVTLRNTIVANSSSGNCGGSAISNGGNNIDDGATCGWGSANGSMSNTNPQLGALALNAPGTTQTFALLAGSPALDNGNNATCPGTDQRGIGRPQGAACDIGAYELAVAAPIPTLSEWGVILLAGMLGLLGMNVMRRNSEIV